MMNIIQSLENYVVEQINKEIKRLNPSSAGARKMVSEIESTNYAIEQVLQGHTDVKNRRNDVNAYLQFVEASTAVDYGRIRERVIGTREIPTFIEDVANHKVDDLLNVNDQNYIITPITTEDFCQMMPGQVSVAKSAISNTLTSGQIQGLSKIAFAKVDVNREVCSEHEVD